MHNNYMQVYCCLMDTSVTAEPIYFIISHYIQNTSVPPASGQQYFFHIAMEQQCNASLCHATLTGLCCSGSILLHFEFSIHWKGEKKISHLSWCMARQAWNLGRDWI